MTQENRFNALQITGLIVSVLGLLFMAFPSVVGVFAVRMITLLFVILGFYAMTFSIFVKSKVSMFISLVVIFLAYVAFKNPQSVLFLVGITCIISGLNGLFLVLSRFRASSERTMISSIILLLLGVFAVVNSKAALSTVVLILGIIIVILGVIMFFFGSAIPKNKTHSFFYTFNGFSGFAETTDRETNKKDRVIVNIDVDEVEEIDYKDV
jgi:uncharacterized membrane protein HdeD (DUF308 family)